MRGTVITLERDLGGAPLLRAGGAPDGGGVIRVVNLFKISCSSLFFSEEVFLLSFATASISFFRSCRKVFSRVVSLPDFFNAAILFYKIASRELYLLSNLEIVDSIPPFRVDSN